MESPLFTDIVDVDGFGAADKAQVTVLGGFLGQLMIVLSTISKHFPRVDQPITSSASVRSKKTAQSGVDQATEEKAESVASEPAHKVLDTRVVQTFIYNYVLNKLKVDRLPV